MSEKVSPSAEQLEKELTAEDQALQSRYPTGGSMELPTDDEVEDVKQKVEGLINDPDPTVKANVPLEGNEQTLASLKIGETSYAVKTYQKFPTTWNTTGTTKAFCDSVNADADAVEGMSFLGELACTDLPAGMVNAEAVVEITKSAVGSSKVIHLVITSGNQAPYRWERTYWNSGSNDSGWISFMNAGEVAANPLDEASTNLNKLKVGNTVYGIPQGTSVEANPEEESTEALTKIKIGGVVYSVEGGSGDLDELMQEEF